MSPAIKCLILLAVVALFFITELIPLAITATAGAIACGLLGLLPAKQVFSGLSNSTVVLFAGMLVLTLLKKLKKVVKMPCVIAWHFCFNKNERAGRNTVDKRGFEIYAVNSKRKK